jgi:hypothetical protein
MPWVWDDSFLSEVIVSYVELKKGVGDAFSGEAFACETKKSGSPVWGCRLVGL